MSVFTGMDGRAIDEAASTAGEMHRRSSGYPASKWAAEQIVETARGRGMVCNIIRLGLITGDTLFGRNDETQFFHRLVRTSLMLGKGFGDHPAAMRMTPVDYAAQAIAHLSLRANGLGETFHLPTMAPLGFADFFAVYNQRSDRRLPLSSYSAWGRRGGGRASCGRRSTGAAFGVRRGQVGRHHAASRSGSPS